MNHGDLRLPGNIDSVAKIVESVDGVAKHAGLSSKARRGLLLAADEIATNIVRHAYEEVGVHGDISFATAQEGDYLVITLEDTGRAFDPRETPKPANLGTPLEERAVGGLGIFLALKQLDKFHYERRDGRNISRLIIRLGS